jgi:hypothetical protein
VYFALEKRVHALSMRMCVDRYDAVRPRNAATIPETA